jgi:predicted nucleotidyltransferase
VIDTYYSDEFDVSFDICSDPVESCPFNNWDSPPASWIEPPDMNVFVSSGEAITSSFSYADWKDDFTNVCGSSICGEITFEFDVYYKKDSTDPQDLLDVMDNSDPTVHSYAVSKPSAEEY